MLYYTSKCRIYTYNEAFYLRKEVLTLDKIERWKWMSKKMKSMLAAMILTVTSISTYGQELGETINNTNSIQLENQSGIVSEGNDPWSDPFGETTYHLPADTDPIDVNSTDVNPEDQGNLIEGELARRELLLKLNVAKAWINGIENPLSAPPKVINGRTYLPLRFTIDELVEGAVDWNKDTNTATITKGSTVVIVQVSNTEVLVNGEKVIVETPAIMENGFTYLPVRVMADLFGIQTEYDEKEKTIKLIKSLSDDGSFGGATNRAPVADFTFSQDSYVAGQIVESIDTSYDEDGDLIVEKEWMINNNPKLKTAKLETMFKTPTAGFYTISLRVKDIKGAWSEWYTKEIWIQPNEKPVVTSLETSKEAYAGGEELAFTYTYENEEWEAIKSERWTYRHISEPESKAVVDKPKYIFDEGQYIITLQLEDAYGNLGDKKEVLVNITSESRISEYEYRFKNGTIGDVIDNFKNFNYQQYKEIMATSTIMGDGTLIMSDSPELVKANGILYKETAEGQGRLMFHHINDFADEENAIEAKKLVIIAENTTDKPVTLVIRNKSIKGPSSDILYVGQQALYEYFQSSQRNEYELKPGEKIYLHDSSNKKWNRGDCISGQMDFYTTGQVTFTFAALGKDAQMEDVLGLPTLDLDIHPRGTFYSTDIYHTVVLEDTEPVKLVIGKGSDEWLIGKDGITGEERLNRGNFGVIYHIKVTAMEDTGVILNPRGGIFRGAVRWNETSSYLAPAKGYFSGNSSKAVMIGVIKKGETKVIEYVLPNGSAAPVLIGFIPESSWGK